MNSNTWAIILYMCLHTYAICGTSGRVVPEGKSLFISVFQIVSKEVVLRAFPVSVAVYTEGLRSVLVRNVLSQAVSRQPLTAEARVQSQAYPVWG